MCSPGSPGARNISTREQLRSNRSNTGTAVLPRRSILNETVGVRKNALAGDRSGHGYRPRHSDNGQRAQSRSRGAAVQAILVAEVTALAAAISHAMGWRWSVAVSRGKRFRPWSFRGPLLAIRTTT